MRNTTTDLTRHDGAGASIASRLPSDPAFRPGAAAVLIDRAVSRWALGPFAVQLHEAAVQMLAEQHDVEPIDMCLRITTADVTLVVGGEQLIVALTPAVAAA